jgi:inhibitor of cysteine peptidase
VHSFRDPTEVVVEAGETFEIVLEGNFTTGYRWELQQQDGISLISEEMRSGGDAPGSAGTQHFRLEAGSVGRHSLAFVYRRPWEDTNIEERRIDVLVR